MIVVIVVVPFKTIQGCNIQPPRQRSYANRAHHQGLCAPLAPETHTCHGLTCTCHWPHLAWLLLAKALSCAVRWHAAMQSPGRGTASLLGSSAQACTVQRWRGRCCCRRMRRPWSCGPRLAVSGGVMSTCPTGLASSTGGYPPSVLPCRPFARLGRKCLAAIAL